MNGYTRSLCTTVLIILMPSIVELIGYLHFIDLCSSLVNIRGFFDLFPVDISFEIIC